MWVGLSNPTILDGKMRLDKSIKYADNLKIIKRDCSEIWNAYKKTGKFLYRGSNNLYHDFQLIKPRIDRKPKNTRPEIQKYLDNEFQKMYGWKPRTEGVFVTGNIGDANYYGEYLYIIFPLNGFKYLWSEKVVDLFANMPDFTFDAEEMMAHVNGEYKMVPLSKEETQAMNIDIEDQLKNIVISYSNRNLLKAIKSYNEVMIKCDGYYAFEYEQNVDLLHKYMKENIKEYSSND